MAQPLEEDLLGVKKIAGLMGVGQDTVWRWCREGNLPYLKIGKHWRMRREALEDFLKQSERPATLVGRLRSFLRMPDDVLAVAQRSPPTRDRASLPLHQSPSKNRPGGQEERRHEAPAGYGYDYAAASGVAPPPTEHRSILSRAGTRFAPHRAFADSGSLVPAPRAEEKPRGLASRDARSAVRDGIILARRYGRLGGDGPPDGRAPFALVRNPIFAAMIPAVLCLALMVPNTAALTGFLALVVAVELQVRLVEEPYLFRTHAARGTFARREVHAGLREVEAVTEGCQTFPPTRTSTDTQSRRFQADGTISSHVPPPHVISRTSW